jgi:hypothetical protein
LVPFYYSFHGPDFFWVFFGGGVQSVIFCTTFSQLTMTMPRQQHDEQSFPATCRPEETAFTTLAQADGLAAYLGKEAANTRSDSGTSNTGALPIAFKRSSSDGLPLPSRTAAAQAADALARYTSAPLSGSHEAADKGVAARQRPDDEAERPVLAQLCDPERFQKAVPVMLSVGCCADGERVLRVHHVRSSAECTQVASLLLSALTMSRYWGIPSSTERVIELGVPGFEDKVGSIYLKLGSFECMKRLANIVGREDF